MIYLKDCSPLCGSGLWEGLGWVVHLDPSGLSRGCLEDPFLRQLSPAHSPSLSTQVSSSEVSARSVGFPQCGGHHTTILLTEQLVSLRWAFQKRAFRNAQVEAARLHIHWSRNFPRPTHIQESLHLSMRDWFAHVSREGIDGNQLEDKCHSHFSVLPFLPWSKILIVPTWYKGSFICAGLCPSRIRYPHSSHGKLFKRHSETLDPPKSHL